MTPKDIVIDPRGTLGSQTILLDVRPAYEYKEGVRTDTVLGYRYEVVCPQKNFEKIAVRIDGKKLMETPESPVEVRFSELEIFLYGPLGQLKVGARACGITPAQAKA